MEQPGSIKGLTSPIGSRSSSGSPVYIAPQPGTPKRSHTSLKTGEIIKGIILEAGPGKDAIVRLPHGDFSATLSGKLKRGDSLFFKVMESEPRLHLKIFAVPVKKDGVEISNEELLRLLDLPSSEFDSDLVAFLKSRRNLINREEYLSILKLYNSLPEAEQKNSDVKSLLKTLFYFNESSLAFELETYLRIKYAFSDVKDYSRLMRELVKQAEYLPEDIKKGLKKLLSYSYQPELNLTKLLEYLGKSLTHSKHENQLYEFIDFFMKSDFFKNDFPKTLCHFFEGISQTLESQYYISQMAPQWNSPQLFLMPFIFRGNFKLGRLTIKKMSQFKPAKNLLKFSIEIFSQSFGDIVLNISYLDKHISVGIFSADPKAIADLKSRIREIEELLRRQDFVIRSLTVNETSNLMLDTLSELNSPSGTNISVVI